MSFSTALTGLHGAQAEIAATSNNIANVGTTGFKRSTAEFGDIFSNSPSTASKFTIGSGTLLKSVRQEFSQGNIATSGNTLDIAITGQGFFALKPTLTSAQTMYSRSGSFTVNSDLYVVDSQAQHLQVYPVNSDGSVVSTGWNSIKSLQLPATSGLPKATSSIEMTANLPADSKVIASTTPFDKTDPTTFNQSSSVNIYDTLGNAHVATIYYAKTKNADGASPTNKWQTYVFLGDTEIKPQPQQSTNAQGEVYYINQVGQIAPASQVPPLDIAAPNQAAPLYRVDQQTDTQPSRPASVIGASIDASIFDPNTNQVHIVTDPELYATTREADPNSKIFWGVDMFTLSVDGSQPQSISIDAGDYTPTSLAAALTVAANKKFDDPGTFTIRDTLRKDGATILQGNDILQIDLLKPDGEAMLSLTNPIEIDLFGSAGAAGTPVSSSPGPSQMDLTRDELVSLTQQKLNDALNKRRVEFQQSANWPDPANPPIVVGYDVENRAFTFKADPVQLAQFSSFKVFNPTSNLNDLGIPSKANSPEAAIRADSMWTGNEALTKIGVFSQDQRTGIAVTFDGVAKRFQFSSGSTGTASNITVGRSVLASTAQPQIDSFNIDEKISNYSIPHQLSFDVDGRVLTYDYTPPTLDSATNKAAFLDGLAQAVPVNFKQEKVASASSTADQAMGLKPYGNLMNGDTFQLTIAPSAGADAVQLTVGPLVFNPTDATADPVVKLQQLINDSIAGYNQANLSKPIDVTCEKNTANQFQFLSTTSNLSLSASMMQTIRGSNSTLARVNFLGGPGELQAGSASDNEKWALTASGDLLVGDSFNLSIVPSPGSAPVLLPVNDIYLTDTANTPSVSLAEQINQSINDYNTGHPDQEIMVACSYVDKKFIFEWNTPGLINAPVSLEQKYQYDKTESWLLPPISYSDKTVIRAATSIVTGTNKTPTKQTIALTSQSGLNPAFQVGDSYRLSIPTSDGTEISTDIVITPDMLANLNFGAQSFTVPVNDPAGLPLMDLTFNRNADGSAVIGTWKNDGLIIGSMSIEQTKVAGIQVRPINIGPFSVGKAGNNLTVSGAPTGEGYRLVTRIDGVLLSKDGVLSTRGSLIGSATQTSSFSGVNYLLGVGAGLVQTSVDGAGLQSTPASAQGARAITPMTTSFIPDVVKKENEITVAVDGVVGTIILPIGIYDGNSMAAALQERINQFEDPKTGHKISGASVKFDPANNRLTFTSGSVGPNSQINVLGPAIYGLTKVTQTPGATPTWMKPTQAEYAPGKKLFVNADGQITQDVQLWDASKWYPLYLDDGEITFDTFGKIVSPLQGIRYSPLPLDNGAAPLDLTVNFGKGTTQFNSPFAVTALSQDGYSSGSMDGLDIDASGTVRVSYSNGQTTALGKIVLSTFANVNGLKQIGNADYMATADSGEARMGQAGSGGFGNIKAGALEQSNVDVTEELVNLITSQRNFQASAKMIDTQKQLTETLIQIR